MSYLPELRSSLVEAARRKNADATEPERRHRGRRWLTAGTVATALAAATAVAVAVVALVVLGHRQINTQSGSSPPATKSELRHSAIRLLDHMGLPSGAVVSGLVPGTPADLWSSSSGLTIPVRVDVHRVWRLPQTPDRVIAFIEAHRPPGSSVGLGEESSGSPGAGGVAPPAGSGASGREVVYSAATVIDFPGTPAGIWRQLALHAVALRGGGSALRVDSQAGWLMPRPAGERIPRGVARIALVLTGGRRGQHESVMITSPRQVQEFVSLFNSVPTAWPGSSQCQRGPSGSIRFAFEGPGRTAPLALAVLKVPCNTVQLTIAGRPQTPLMVGFPSSPPDPRLYELLALPLAPNGGKAAVGVYRKSSSAQIGSSTAKSVHEARAPTH